MWTYNSVFYQIYPIGFCGAPVHNDGVTVPRIRKIMEWSDYLKDLGLDSILLNPIFDSDNHGYDTRDLRIGSTLVLMVTVVITMGSGMKDGKDILNWSN